MTATRTDVPPCNCHTRLGCEAHGPQPREHAVTCRHCQRATWALDAVCDECHRSRVVSHVLDAVATTLAARGAIPDERLLDIVRMLVGGAGRDV